MDPKVRILPMKFKLFGLLAVIVTFTIFVISWRISSLQTEDKVAFVSEFHSVLATSLSKSVDQRLTFIEDKIKSFVSERDLLTKTGARAEEQLPQLFRPRPQMLAIGVAKPDGTGIYSPEWLLRNPDYDSALLVPGIESKIVSVAGPMDFIKGAKLERFLARIPISATEFAIVLGVQIKSEVHSAASSLGSASGPLPSAAEAAAQVPSVVNPESSLRPWAYAIFSDKFFDDLYKEFESGVARVFLIDTRGVVLSHPDKSKRGQALKDQVFFGDFKSEKASNGVGEFTDLAGQITLGSFEAIPHSNLV